MKKTTIKRIKKCYRFSFIPIILWRHKKRRFHWNDCGKGGKTDAAGFHQWRLQQQLSKHSNCWTNGDASPVLDVSVSGHPEHSRVCSSVFQYLISHTIYRGELSRSFYWFIVEKPSLSAFISLSTQTCFATDTLQLLCSTLSEDYSGLWHIYIYIMEDRLAETFILAVEVKL